MNKRLSDDDMKSLTQVLGAAGLSDEKAKRELFSQDIWSVGETADFVISPHNTEQLSEAVKIASRGKVRLNPRGGGMSYTNGYTPSKDKTGILDFSKMDKILEINADDMYVTVQAGVTWMALYEALKPLGLRTPFWGPLSGFSSTIGGGLSQNNAFFGAGTHGPSTDSVTSLTVVLADGTIVKTGTAASPRGKPFWRQYGPDLTGLFLSDAGALAYKAEATFRLIPLPAHEGYASFEFDTSDGWVRSQMEMGRLGLACELFGFDPNLQAVRMKRASFAADVKSLTNVITKQKGGILKGLKEGAKVAMAGRGYMDNVAYSVHFMVEGHSDAEVAAKVKTLKDIAVRHGGSEIENSIPKIMRANPFGPLNNILGPQGERWVPIHGIVGMGDGAECLAEIEALFASMEDGFNTHEITTGYLLTTLSTNGFLIEPVFIWPEEIHPIHEITVEPSVLKRIKRFETNPDATDFVKQARQGILDIFSKYGAAHFQIGRTYPYAKNMSPETFEVLKMIKAGLDPDGVINSGALGLD
ncbi:FAD-binding oxidoreductase [Fretibacter rubidus]|uniref:FAD-binding oxidoreductase n=1 Tax=Fretibacter rubidus TaxID=570162 RepID=UPI00352AF7F4